jgi:hypothetical protein
MARLTSTTAVGKLKHTQRYENRRLISKQTNNLRIRTLASLQLVLAAALTESAAAQPLSVSTEAIEIQFAPRTPNQMMSFYEARGFPKEMLNILRKECFITVRIHNKSREIIWHDLANWRFSHDDKPLKREHREYWLQKWHSMQIPLASISTFRWTLLPETLDYLPDEEEGGNIILPRVNGPIALSATFASGDDQRGPIITITHDRLNCAEDTE